MPDILESYLQISLNYGLIAVCTLHCNRTSSVLHAISGKVLQHHLVFSKSPLIPANCTLQHWVYRKKNFQYTPEVPKSHSNILTSPKKAEEAGKKHSLNLDFQAFLGLFLLYSLLNPISHGIS
jgi:hypothetical protein